MGLYKGTPTSILPAEEVNPVRGIGYELGRDLAAQLGIHYTPLVFEKNADVLAAVKNGEVDLVFTNASADRAKYIQFSKTVIRIEKGFLINPKSMIQSQAQINQPTTKIGYSVGSNSQSELPAIIPKATLVQTTSTKQAIAMLKAGEIDGFSSNKAILFEMASSVPGSRVLPDVIGYENLALGTPIARQDSARYLNEFVDQMITSGKLNIFIQRSGIQGLAPN
ncbi:transporter substrate-binding domain-containing protein [Polynucleobacter wuianus]|uniref:transporter substrate-binding domain-containing protein n=1 Tax=Polynucleobacter wuianus TaxID=1743168 RepID=UPI001C0B1AD1|nr:transporter substrate-binding domain-containing protein [Polynucleobacter wuianus]MBU3609465.1 transporter substrate-binding domain-containing protein [Polynucleobacter wuianus]